MALTPKQQRFVEEYLIDLNATQAAIRAGYSPKGATVRGAELLANRNVAAAVEAAKSKRSERTGVTQDWVIGKLVENVNRAMQAEPVCDGKGNETGEYQYEGAVANGALKLLGEHLGMFKQKIEHSGAVVQTHIYLPKKGSLNGGDGKPA